MISPFGSLFFGDHHRHFDSICALFYSLYGLEQTRQTHESQGVVLVLGVGGSTANFFFSFQPQQLHVHGSHDSCKDGESQKTLVVVLEMFRA